MPFSSLKRTIVIKYLLAFPWVKNSRMAWLGGFFLSLISLYSRCSQAAVIWRLHWWEGQPFSWLVRPGYYWQAPVPHDKGKGLLEGPHSMLTGYPRANNLRAYPGRHNALHDLTSKGCCRFLYILLVTQPTLIEWGREPLKGMKTKHWGFWKLSMRVATILGIFSNLYTYMMLITYVFWERSSHVDSL